MSKNKFTILSALSFILTLVLVFFMDTGIFTVADDFSSSGAKVYSNSLIIDSSNTGGDLALQFGASSAQSLNWDNTNGHFELSYPLTISDTNTGLKMGDGTAADHTLVFDDGTDRVFGWDDSTGTFSTFGTPFSYRMTLSAEPPSTCSATSTGRMFMDSASGITFLCDGSRSKWLSVQEFTLKGEDLDSCAASGTPDSAEGCNVDWGASLGSDTTTALGLFIPYPATVTGYAFSEIADDCTSGSFALEVWSTERSDEDNTYSMVAQLATSLSGEAHNGGGLDLDLQGDEYIIWGVNNGCGQTLDDLNLSISYRYRHP